MKLRRISNERCLKLGKTCKPDFPWIEYNSMSYSSGREALVALIQSLELKEGDIVLLPSYVPEGIIAPCHINNLQIIFYRLDGNLDPDWDYLNELLFVNQPKLAILIHFFGIKRDICRFVSLLHNYGVLVLEDFAHMHILSESNMGLKSDFTLHSLRKIIGVPDGAILQINLPQFHVLSPKKSLDIRRFIYIIMNFSQLLFTTISRTLGSPKFWDSFWKIFGRFFSSYRFLMWYYKNPTPMSRLSKIFLYRFPWRETVIKRIKFEKLYYDLLDRNIFKHLCLTEEGHCSMGYAVVVNNRNSLIATLEKCGIYGIWFEYKWDHFPDNDIHDDAKWVMKNHFLFPTSYSLSEAEIRKVIQLANEWAKKG